MVGKPDFHVRCFNLNVYNFHYASANCVMGVRQLVTRNE